MACPRFTDEALLESRYVCTVKYRTHPSHEMDPRVCCLWELKGLQLVARCRVRYWKLYELLKSGVRLPCAF